jgi:hypothetical protein
MTREKGLLNRNRRIVSRMRRDPPTVLATEPCWQTQVPNLSAARALAFAASSSRFFGSAFVSSELRRRVEIAAISSTAARNEPSFAFDGLLKPLIFLTNWSEAARISFGGDGWIEIEEGFDIPAHHYDLKVRNSQRTELCSRVTIHLSSILR